MSSNQYGVPQQYPVQGVPFAPPVLVRKSSWVVLSRRSMCAGLLVGAYGFLWYFMYDSLGCLQNQSPDDGRVQSSGPDVKETYGP